MRRLLMLTCAVLALASLTVSSGAFTSAEADRGVSVDAVGDEDAYMALDYPEATVERDGAVNGTVTLPVVDVTNQFTEAVTVTVEYTAEGENRLSATDGSNTTDLTVGETTAVSTTVTCPSDAGAYELSLAFDATADGNGAYAETSEPRTVDYRVDCNYRSH